MWFTTFPLARPAAMIPAPTSACRPHASPGASLCPFHDGAATLDALLAARAGLAESSCHERVKRLAAGTGAAAMAQP